MTARSFFIIMLLIGLFTPGPLPAKSELPHDFVERVPLYPSAKAVETRHTRDSLSVRFTTDDRYAQVADFYAKALEEAGWLLLPVTSVGVIQAEKASPGRNDIELSIKEVSSPAGRPSNFIIDLYYPGGRE